MPVLPPFRVQRSARERHQRGARYPTLSPCLRRLDPVDSGRRPGRLRATRAGSSCKPVVAAETSGLDTPSWDRQAWPADTKNGRGHNASNGSGHQCRHDDPDGDVPRHNLDANEHIVAADDEGGQPGCHRGDPNIHRPRPIRPAPVQQRDGDGADQPDDPAANSAVGSSDQGGPRCDGESAESNPPETRTSSKRKSSGASTASVTPPATGPLRAHRCQRCTQTDRTGLQSDRRLKPRTSPPPRSQSTWRANLSAVSCATTATRGWEARPLSGSGPLPLGLLPEWEAPV